jgi:homogentisate 1,2-dioxygenase
VFGSLECRAGDYVVVPTSTTHRWIVEAGEPVHALILEARGHVGPPDRYLSPTGQFLEHSPYCERDLHAPDEPLVVDGTDGDQPIEVLVRQRDGLTRYGYAHHPFDVVGWDGCLYPYRLSIHDFEPVTGRVHQPPPVHQTFAGPRFVVCSFVPRKLDYHPLAVPVPYNHANVDSDEVLYYCAGDFTSRKGAGIEPGSSPEASSGPWARRRPTRWRSCSTRSIRCCWRTARAPATTPTMPGRGRGRRGH